MRFGTGLVVWVGLKMGQCNYKCNYIKLITDVTTYSYFLKYKYNVKTCMYTISALYQIINLNVSIK